APWNTHDMADAAKLHALMDDGDVLVGDRAFGSFAHLALLLQQNLHGLFRLHQRTIVDFSPASTRQTRPGSKKKHRKGLTAATLVRTLGPADQIVTYPRPGTAPRSLSRDEFTALPATITVRELRYRVQGRGFRTQDVILVTTLLDPRQYSRQDLIDLYAARWQIETNLRHLKQTMR